MHMHIISIESLPSYLYEYQKGKILQHNVIIWLIVRDPGHDGGATLYPKDILHFHL